MNSRFPSNYTSEEGDADDTVHTYAMAENVLDIVVRTLKNCIILQALKIIKYFSQKIP